MTTGKTKLVILTTAVTAVLLVGSVGVFAFSLGKYDKVKANAGVVSIPLAKVSDGKARFYRIDESGKEITFFVVKAPDGSFRTAFDACDVCYREKKGYEQKGDFVVCKNCNKQFATNRIGPHETGGCNPSYLPHTLKGGNIVINLNDLKAGARFF